MKKLLSRHDEAKTGMDELRRLLRIATTADMRSMVSQNAFESERELVINLLAAAIWEIDAVDLARICGLSLEAAKAIQELAMKEVATMTVPVRD